MGKTIQRLAKEAYDIQDACNLTAIAIAFGEAMRDLRVALESSGQSVRGHPIAKAWADKIAHLAGTQGQSLGEAIGALEGVERLAGG